MKHLKNSNLPKDVNLKGEIVERTGGINSEHCHRAKSLSHVSVRKQHTDEIMKLNEKKENEKRRDKMKVMALYEDNDECFIRILY